jgi:hypothetical protein
MTASALNVHDAYLAIERHRPRGPEQQPWCSGCQQLWPCRHRVAAAEVIRSVLRDAWAGRP